MQWFKKKKNPDEYVGFSIDHQGIDISESDIVLFPDRNTVFLNKEALHSKVFFPLCSINMELINAEWAFYAHFVYVFREQEEDISLTKYYTPYCGDYSLGFDHIDGKYTLQAKLEMLEISDRYNKYQQKAAEKYNRFAKDYKENGVDNILPYKESYNFLIKRFGKSPKWIQKDETPKDLSGEPMVFVGQVRVLDFIGEGQYLYLFYSPQFHYFVQREQYY